jgi:hypothetical protein
MNQEEIKAKSAALAELYTAKANGKTLQHEVSFSGDGLWVDHVNESGPNLASDLSRWRVKQEPRRRWEIEHTATRTNSQDTANQWAAEGYHVIEWMEVLP